MPDLERIRAHLFGRGHMAGVARGRARTRRTGEVFTPAPLVERMLDDLDPQLFADPAKTFLDPSCGDGQFLAGVLWRRLRNGMEFRPALAGLFGVELMPDNAALCRARLLCGRNEHADVAERNIVCADALRYHYRFDGSPPDDAEAAAARQSEQFGRLFRPA